MRRVLIVGSPGGGKSTLATKLAAITGLPLIHLDAHYWQPEWRKPSRDAWQERVTELLRGKTWIMDGNYRGTFAMRLEAADTVILIALPRVQCLYRVVKRGIRYRGRTRPDLHPGCREHLPDWAFLRWIWSYPDVDLPIVLEMLRAQEGTKTMVVLRSTLEVECYLIAVTAAATCTTD